ncbi:hypothetical protein CTI12_AA271490 [Artemisia annua]|uniref:Hydrophobic seed protein domain-containing protein n=1 Tax=Artemisia annua TaxID=35608 RepID=A0A2U1NCZ3_ARTAN|nr:hypothetical protein CTI12_AA271490 [Artemisia annua]
MTKPPKVLPPITRPPIVRPPPVTRPPIVQPPIVRPPPVTRPPIVRPPIVQPPPVTRPPIVRPPIVRPPPVTRPPIVMPPVILPPPILPPPVINPPVIMPPVISPPLGACVDVLGGLVHIGLGNPVENVCCPVLQGLLELEAAVCLCTTIRLKLLNLNIFIPLALQALITCGMTPPPGFIGGGTTDRRRNNRSTAKQQIVSEVEGGLSANRRRTTKTTVYGGLDYESLNHQMLRSLVDEVLIFLSIIRDFNNYFAQIGRNFKTIVAVHRWANNARLVTNVSVLLFCLNAIDDPVCTDESIPWDEIRTTGLDAKALRLSNQAESLTDPVELLIREIWDVVEVIV